MARKLKSDKLLFMAAFLLICTSVVMVYSASAMLADARYQQQYWFLMKQVTWTILGMALLLVAMRIDYRRYGEPVVIWTAVGTVGLALVAVLFSTPINGARRWLGLGGTGMQPSEAAKLAAIFFTAAVLERRMDRMDEIRYALLPVAILVGRPGLPGFASSIVAGGRGTSTGAATGARRAASAAAFLVRTGAVRSSTSGTSSARVHSAKPLRQTSAERGSGWPRIESTSWSNGTGPRLWLLPAKNQRSRAIYRFATARACSVNRPSGEVVRMTISPGPLRRTYSLKDPLGITLPGVPFTVTAAPGSVRPPTWTMPGATSSSTC